MNWKLLLTLSLASGAAAQTPTIAAVFNAFSGPALSPGVLASVLGSNFGADKTAVTVTVGGKPGFVLVATGTQLNVQIPVELSPGPTTMTITRSGATSAPFNITLGTYAPAIQTANGTDAVLFTNTGLLAQVKRGDNVSFNATGLGPTNPALATGTPPTPGVLSSCVTTPQLTLGGVAITPSVCVAAPGAIGAYQINFKIPDSATGKLPLVLTIAGISSPPANVTITGPAAITSVVNAASLDKTAPIAPGSMVAILGAGFGAADQVAAFPNVTAQGVSVTMNGLAAPLVSVVANSSTPQIQVMAPAELPEQGQVNVVVTTAEGPSTAFAVNMAAASPGIFRLNYKNYGAVSLINPNTGVAVNCEASGVLAAAYCGRTFRAGDTVQIYMTGLGKATPGGDPAGAPLRTGQLSPADGSVVYATVAQPSVTIGNVPAAVSSSSVVAGLVGEYQVTVTIPDGVPSGDDVALKVTAGALSDSVSIAIAGSGN